MRSRASAFVLTATPFLFWRPVHHCRPRTFATMTLTAPPPFVSDVLTFWYGTDSPGRFDIFRSQHALWYSGKPEVDTLIRDKFSDHVSKALTGHYDHLLDVTEHGFHPTLALLILIDQFPRNIHRGTPDAFIGDPHTKRIVHGLISHPTHWARASNEVPTMMRMTFMLPLMHQESLPDQDLCVAEIRKMLAKLNRLDEPEAAECAKSVQVSLDFAIKHRDIIAQFGRFPYRNSVLGRDNTPAEVEFLRDGPRFGQ